MTSVPASESIITNGEALEKPIEAVIEEAIELADGGKVRFGDLLEAWGDRSYGPLFIVLGFFAGTPLAVIPPMAGIAGVVIALLAIQMAFGKHHPWLPRWVLKRTVKEKAIVKTRDKTEGFLASLDSLFSERLTWASGGIARRLAALIIVALGLSMIPFEAIPFAGVAPAIGVMLFGVAITARDGLVMIVSTAAAIGVVIFAASIF
jgi:hypothetical protein